MEKYIFTADISNSPLYPDIARKVSYMDYPVHNLYGDNKKVINQFMIRHFNGGVEIEALNKNIVLTADGQGGNTYPIDLDLTAEGLTGFDSTMVTDIEFYINWLQTDKGLNKLFKLIAILHDIKKYDEQGIESETGIYTFFDCRYLGIK